MKTVLIFFCVTQIVLNWGRKHPRSKSKKVRNKKEKHEVTCDGKKEKVNYFR
jgi:hypothetical protein